MKTIMYTIFFLLVAAAASAQEKQAGTSAPYWVVETSTANPRHSVIKFYTGTDQLAYQETVTGKRVRFENTNVKNRLNKALLQVTVKGSRPADTTWVSAILKGKAGV